MARGIGVLRAVFRSQTEGDRASSRFQVGYREFDLTSHRPAGVVRVGAPWKGPRPRRLCEATR